MPNRSYSKATRLAAVVMARLAGSEIVARTFSADVRTLNAWREATSPADDD